MNDKIKIYKNLVSPFNQSKILLHNEKFHELKSNIIAVPVLSMTNENFTLKSMKFASENFTPGLSS